MRGVAFEGGGARGAYQMGVMKALLENGYTFDGFTGTSIGAVNAAALAQGDFDMALELWANISMEQVFDIDAQSLLELTKIDKKRIDRQLTEQLKAAVTKIIGNRGIDTAIMKAFLEKYLDEDKIRSSGKDFGLVTVSVSERKPYELMLEDIEPGRLLSYIMASASFPGFRPESIDGRVFADGAFYDNCPFKLLLSRGYDEVIAIRTNAFGVVRKPEDTHLQRVKFIKPGEDLGNLMWFSPENSGRCISLGYIDGLRFLDTQ